ncbi:MAG: carbohydrate ABC transporter permease, partial [Phycisphaerales bacterium]
MSRARDTATGLLWVGPDLAGLVLFTGLPAAMALWYSFCDYSLLDAAVPIGLDNYRELLGDARLWRAAINTVVYALGSVAGCTVISLALALLMGRARPGVVLAALFVPTLVPVVSACVVWGWMFSEREGAINRALLSVGVRGPDWLGETRTAMPALIVMSFWSIGTALLVASAAVREVPRALDDAAAIDGMNAWQRARHVTLPMISPAVLFNGVMSVVWSLQVFGPPQIMTRGGPADSTLTVSMYVYSNAFVYDRMGYACALALTQTACIF